MRFTSLAAVAWASCCLVLAVACAPVLGADSAEEIGLDRALNLAVEAERAAGADMGYREVSVARSDGARNLCLLMKHQMRRFNPTQDSELGDLERLLTGRKYYTVIFWIVDPDLVGSNRCVFVDRHKGDLIGGTRF